MLKVSIDSEDLTVLCLYSLNVKASKIHEKLTALNLQKSHNYR